MSSCKEETVSVRGRSVRLYRGGTGAPLLFLHDTFRLAWLPIHERLAANYEVFLPVHPGCAGSEDNVTDLDEIEDLVFHYRDLCDLLRLDRPALVGASFGGWVAAEWAIRYGGTLSQLVLIDALGLHVPDAPSADILSLDPARSRQVIFADADSVVALETIPDNPKPEEVVAVLLARQTLARFAWQFPDNPRLRRYLYRAQVPTLIVWGEGDRFVPVAHGKAYHEGIAHSELVVLPNSGHLPHIETPDACAEIIGNFLRKK